MSEKLSERIWRSVVHRVGGVHEFGRLWLVIHDDGASVAWKQVEKWRWELRPPKVFRRVTMRLAPPAAPSPEQ